MSDGTEKTYIDSIRFGIGCNRLHDYEKDKMIRRGYSPEDLVPIGSLRDWAGAGVTEAEMGELCKGGLPRYRAGENEDGDEVEILVNPKEVAVWSAQALIAVREVRLSTIENLFGLFFR